MRDRIHKGRDPVSLVRQPLKPVLYILRHFVPPRLSNDPMTPILENLELGKRWRQLIGPEVVVVQTSGNDVIVGAGNDEQRGRLRVGGDRGDRQQAAVADEA